jgi:hypothetical protein
MRRSGGTKGGMQSQGINTIYCKCGKSASAIVKFSNGKEIALHFTKKRSYWHIYENGIISKTYKRPEEW